MFLRYSVFFFYVILFVIVRRSCSLFLGVTLLSLTLNLNFQIFRMRLGLM